MIFPCSLAPLSRPCNKTLLLPLKWRRQNDPPLAFSRNGSSDAGAVDRPVCFGHHQPQAGARREAPQRACPGNTAEPAPKYRQRGIPKPGRPRLDKQTPRQRRVCSSFGFAAVDAFVQTCFEEALARGFPLNVLRHSWARLEHHLQTQKFLVVDPDPQLAHILAAEISQAIDREIEFAFPGGAPEMLRSSTCVLVTETSRPRILRSLGPVNHRTIRLKSMQDFLAGHQRPNFPVLIAVVSGSASVLRWARTLLSALGFDADSVLLRNRSMPEWEAGLAACDMVACDVISAAALPLHSGLLFSGWCPTNSYRKCKG